MPSCRLQKQEEPVFKMTPSSPYSLDTSSEAYEVQIECWRNMTPIERLRRAMAWSQVLRKMAFDAIRRNHPEMIEAEVQMQFIENTYGKTLADDVRRWKLESTAWTNSTT